MHEINVRQAVETLSEGKVIESDNPGQFRGRKDRLRSKSFHWGSISLAQRVNVGPRELRQRARIEERNTPSARITGLVDLTDQFDANHSNCSGFPYFVLILYTCTKIQYVRVQIFTNVEWLTTHAIQKWSGILSLVTFPTAPASRGEDVIHACDATRIVLPHRRTGVELCRIRSRPRIHLSAITCPLEEDEEEEEEANSGLASDRVVGIRIADRESREHGSDDTPCFTAAGPFINHGFRIFHAADAVADRDSAGELAAVFGLARQLTMSDAFFFSICLYQLTALLLHFGKILCIENEIFID
ncbi:hypothetical protein EAG_16175 [Camponotus floridanus]|uniref:Uncharacterized protein n=1 Tax=Camponotus floridanus TaxID=104421 RepID=E2A1B6_CAMFO|nr:hypothetical protein EAG_16175 [Camponotus floridanus]